jgi:uncharacterized protein YijF (DUF1287 family)
LFPGRRGKKRAATGRALVRIALVVAAAWLGLPCARADPAWADDLVAAARRQVGVTVGYDGGYARIPYPGGDVPLERGVCTDVVIRAYRALGVDLQVLVHEDLGGHWSSYPHGWGKSPDTNIDHRRVPNLETFFRRRGDELPVSTRASDYAAGDIVSWRLDNGLPHIGLVSRADPEAPLVIHNIGAGARRRRCCSITGWWGISGISRGGRGRSGTRAMFC